ncbi:nicotinate-nucleotide adenylyltransferase [Paraglaciecola sp. 25GB23A]|uniref:nicotinate-nucleotide adenylyltransferase n=1 Tax=Paraglaciecola sp. 25GB23A TaxID=3156068 RepID=UPI0032AFD53B|tara:strand:+ start:2956 stop:3627 length:672 start_codon:yes stop_codon:yes gene_type:complete
MPLSPAIGLFGGTFDPIHNGHIYPVIAAAKLANIDSVALMPNYIPAHKNAAQSTSQQRLAMIKLVCDEYPLFYPEPWEIEQSKVSYSVETLLAFRQRHPHSPICFFIGSDSLYSLPKWHRWQELLGLCHFIVCQREHQTPPKAEENNQIIMQRILAKHQITQVALLQQKLAGYIYLAKTPEINVSSSQIRALLVKGQNPQGLLPSAIYRYIEQFKLYQQSTNI